MAKMHLIEVAKFAIKGLTYGVNSLGLLCLASFRMSMSMDMSLNMSVCVCVGGVG